MKSTALNGRELHVLLQVAQGATHRQIGKGINLSVSAVSMILSRGVFPKLKAVNAQNAVYIAMSRGLLPLACDRTEQT